MYDVIVIGAGPCGCAAAKTLAENGLNVLLTEKCKLPRYKSCSGILIEKSLRFLGERFGREVPKSVTCTPVDNRGMIFTDDFGKEYRFESRGLNIWRDRFDYWLLSLARESGAEVKDESAATSVTATDDIIAVSANGKTEQARYVIDCSGAVGIGKQRHSNIITYQTYNRGKTDLDPHYFYAYLQPELSGYDAWFNVKDDMTVLGVSSPNPDKIKDYYNSFESYMRKNHGLCIDECLKTDKWLIRNITPPFNIDYGENGILKAGESAGFLNPMGEGISCAMESGYHAARAILSSFDDKPAALETYKQLSLETKRYMERQWQLVGRMSQKFSFMNK